MKLPSLRSSKLKQKYGKSIGDGASRVNVGLAIDSRINDRAAGITMGIPCGWYSTFMVEAATGNTIWFSPDQRKPSRIHFGSQQRRRVPALLRGWAGFINLPYKELSVFRKYSQYRWLSPRPRGKRAAILRAPLLDAPIFLKMRRSSLRRLTGTVIPPRKHFKGISNERI